MVPILAKILKMPFLTHTDFIASSLWPNNPSLHPPILYGLFKDWDGVTAFDPACKGPSEPMASLLRSTACLVATSATSQLAQRRHWMTFAKPMRAGVAAVSHLRRLAN